MQLKGVEATIRTPQSMAVNPWLLSKACPSMDDLHRALKLAYEENARGKTDMVHMKMNFSGVNWVDSSITEAKRLPAWFAYKPLGW